VHHRAAVTAGALVVGLGALGALPACNALFGSDVSLAGDGGPDDAPGSGGDAPVVPEACASPLQPCRAPSVAVIGDWDGNGRDTPGLFDSGRWCYTNTRAAGDVCHATAWGTAGDTPIVGDWNGDGVDTPGVFDDEHWNLKEATEGGGPADFEWGSIGIEPIAGDWEGRDKDTPGGVSNVGAGNTWELSNRNSAGGIDRSFKFGTSATIPLVGDWDGSGTDTPATYRDGLWSFSNANDMGGVAAMFLWGIPGDVPVVGDWDGDGFDTVGLYRDGAWLLTDDHIDAIVGTTQEPAYMPFRWGTD
jgi:hypothetical protein